MRYVILDTETTGLEPKEGHRIIEIGCVEVVNRKITGRHYHQYINPQREIDQGAIDVHGITNDFLKDKPVFVDVVQDFMAFIQDAILVIHNAPFDTAFINHELNLTRQSWKSVADYCQVIDTLVLARQMHAGQRNSLDALCKRYDIDNSRRDLHGALLDANLLAKVYLAMTGGQGSLFDDSGLNNTDEQKRDKPVIDFSVDANIPLRIIQPDPVELDLHDKKLQAMKDKSGCVWSEL